MLQMVNFTLDGKYFQIFRRCTTEWYKKFENKFNRDLLYDFYFWFTLGTLYNYQQRVCNFSR